MFCLFFTVQIISFQSFSLFSIVSITFFIENIVNFKVFTYIYDVFFAFVHNGTSKITLCVGYLLISP